MGKIDKAAPSNQDSDYAVYEGTEPFWNCMPDAEHVLRTSEGPGSSHEFIPPMTITQAFDIACEKNGDQPALATENLNTPPAKGKKHEKALKLKQWKTWTWNQYREDCRSFAKSCLKLGLEQHDSVNVFGFNSPEWMIAMFGAMFAGGKCAGIYPSDNIDSVQFKSDHSNGVVAALEGRKEFEKFKAAADGLPKLAAIVIWGTDCVEGDFKTSDGREIKVFQWNDFLNLGKTEEDDAALEERNKLIKPNHCCVLVYTSGTTGRPKAVMLCHDSLVWGVLTVGVEARFGTKKNAQDRIVSYLPLSHVAGLMVDAIAPMGLTTQLRGKGYATTYFARSYDLKRGTLGERLQAVRPTIFLGAPRVWEKIMEKMKQVGASSGAITKKLGAFAKKRAALYTSSRQLGGAAKNPKTMGIANAILGKIKTKLGLNKAYFFLSGAAPLSMECLEYFGSLGIAINEVYGMSETSGVGTFSTNDHHVWGSVGYEMRGNEVRVFNKGGEGGETPRSKDLFHPTEEEQGEICFRGRNLMMGYMANPRLGDDHVNEIKEKNADAIDEKGWLHSGDKGTRDERGMYKITGRYKELIIGAGGENIAPVPIEDAVKAGCDIISNAIMIGNKRKFNVMLITLKAQGATGELAGNNNLDGAAKTFSEAKTISEAMEDGKIIQAITDVIAEVNKNEEVVPSNAAKVQKFTILPRDVSVETEELTATLKLKRTVVEEEFDPIISKMFEVDDAYVNYNLAPTPGLAMGSAAEQVPEQDLMNMSKIVRDAVEEEETGEKKEDNEDKEEAKEE